MFTKSFHWINKVVTQKESITHGILINYKWKRDLGTPLEPSVQTYHSLEQLGHCPSDVMS
jgi:hypothetical protein